MFVENPNQKKAIAIPMSGPAAQALSSLLQLHVRQAGDTSKIQTHTWFLPKRKHPVTLSIPDENAFMRIWCDALEEERMQEPRMLGRLTHQGLCVSEKLDKTDPVFAMFMDIDMTPQMASELGGPAFMNAFVDKVVAAMDHVVCENATEEVNMQCYKAQRVFYKVHLHWPHLVVRKKDAISLFNNLLSRLSKDDQLRNLPLDRILDKSVYNTGLRLLGAHKGNKSKMDDMDEHLRWFPDVPYAECYWLRDPDLLAMSVVDMVLATSIRPRHHVVQLKSVAMPPVMVAGLTQDIENLKIRSEGSASDEPVFDESIRGADIDMTLYDGDTTREIGLMLKEASQQCQVELRLSRMAKLSATHIRMDLMASPCPWAKRLHSRTQERNQSALWIHLTPHEGILKCWKCADTMVICNELSDNLREKLFKLTSLDATLLKCLRSSTSELVTEFLLACFGDTHAACQRGDTSFRWFTFLANKHKWVEYRFVIEDIMKEKGPVQQTLQQHARKLIKHEDDAKESQKIQQWAAKLACKLQSWAYLQRDILPVLGYKLHVQCLHRHGVSFAEVLDQDPCLLGCANGVYDFRNKEFRDGRPSDHISRTTNVLYVPWGAMGQEMISKREEMMTALRKIWPVEEEFRFFMYLLSRALDGTPTTQQFFIPIGHGANGKSLAWKLINLALGDYSGECDVTFFTRPRPSSNVPQEDLMAMIGKRIVACNEPSEREVLYTGQMKAVTGGDRQTGRHNYGQNQSFYLQCTFFMLCNRIPQINAPPDDYGTWRRIRPLPFRSRFTDKPTRAGDVMADPDIVVKLPQWKECFLSLLIHYAETVDFVEEPEFYRHARLMLRDQHNHYDRFIQDHVDQEDKDSITTCVHMYSAMRNYIKNMGLNKVVTYDEFLRKMTVTLGDPVKDPLTHTLQWKVGLHEPMKET